MIVGTIALIASAYGVASSSALSMLVVVCLRMFVTSVPSLYLCGYLYAMVATAILMSLSSLCSSPCSCCVVSSVVALLVLVLVFVLGAVAAV